MANFIYDCCIFGDLKGPQIEPLLTWIVKLTKVYHMLL